MCHLDVLCFHTMSARQSYTQTNTHRIWRRLGKMWANGKRVHVKMSLCLWWNSILVIKTDFNLRNFSIWWFMKKRERKIEFKWEPLASSRMSIITKCLTFNYAILRFTSSWFTCSVIFVYRFSGHSCDDFHWFWLFNDIPQEVWIQFVCFQFAGSSSCDSMGIFSTRHFSTRQWCNSVSYRQYKCMRNYPPIPARNKIGMHGSEYGFAFICRLA